MTLEDIKKKKGTYELFTIFGFFIMFISFVIGIALSKENSNTIYLVFMYIGAAIGLGILLLFSTLFMKLKKYYKAQFVSDTFKRAFPELTFIAERGFNENEVYDSGIIRKASRFTSEDYIKGLVNSKPFESADIHLQDLRSTGKSMHYVTVFQGRFYKIHMDKHFPANVLILPKRYNRFTLSQKYQRFDMESIGFTKDFEVYSTDHFEAVKIVKPVVIERMMSFETDARSVMFGFIDRTLYIAIDTRMDNFDIQLFHEIDADIEKDIKEELALTSDLIELVT